jgi:hypothetical protein
MRVAVLGTANYANNAEFGGAGGWRCVGRLSRPPSRIHDVLQSFQGQSQTVELRDRRVPLWAAGSLRLLHGGLGPAGGFSPISPRTTTWAQARSPATASIAGISRSFDRTSGSLDNAFTFYLTNIIPQAADLNQGPWALLENYLADRARLDNRESRHHRRRGGNRDTQKRRQDRDPHEYVEGGADCAARPWAGRRPFVPGCRSDYP